MTYDAKADGEGSYLAAIEAKRARGDDYYPSPDQDARLLRSIPKGVSDLSGQYTSCSGVNDSLCGSLPSDSVARPSIGQEQFPGNLHGIDVLNTRGSSPDGYCDGWGEPVSDHGGAA